jgi:hypothetical protein
VRTTRQLQAQVAHLERQLKESQLAEAEPKPELVAQVA